MDAPTWLSGNTPLGIEVPILPRGSFPVADNIVGAEMGLDPWAPSRGNYDSYKDYKDAADAVIQEELDLGRLEWAPTMGELTKKYASHPDVSPDVSPPGVSRPCTFPLDVSCQTFAPQRFRLSPRLTSLPSSCRPFLGTPQSCPHRMS